MGRSGRWVDARLMQAVLCVAAGLWLFLKTGPGPLSFSLSLSFSFSSVPRLSCLSSALRRSCSRSLKRPGEERAENRREDNAPSLAVPAWKSGCCPCTSGARTVTRSRSEQWWKDTSHTNQASFSHSVFAQ